MVDENGTPVFGRNATPGSLYRVSRSEGMQFIAAVATWLQGARRPEAESVEGIMADLQAEREETAEWRERAIAAEAKIERMEGFLRGTIEELGGAGDQDRHHADPA